jgi:capsular polysaccharide biosynthesis protein
LQNNTQYIQEDKIDLRELFSILKRRKKLIWSVTGTLTILAVAYVLIKQPVYEVKSNIMVGFIGEKTKDKSNNIADPAIITKTLNIIFNVEDKLETEKKFISKVSSISINKNIENFITIKTEAITNELALKKNKEVIQYIQDLYQPIINKYITDINNSIEDTFLKIKKLENLETKNLQNKINLIKTQKIVKINEKIKKLQNQDIKNLQQEIDILKTQKIIELKDKIEFYKNVKIPTLNEKIRFHTQKLSEYEQAVKNIYQDNKKIKDSSVLTISSLQMVNYQNLILNSQNRIEDFKVTIEKINNETIPNLQRKISNIEEVSIKKLQLQIDNINNITIVNLEREKNNIRKDTLRKLTYKLNVELPNKKEKYNNLIRQLEYKKSPYNIQNSKVIGEYVVKDYPIKPKKKLIVIIAFITGLMLSIFLAFFLEFIASIKKEKEN